MKNLFITLGMAVVLFTTANSKAATNAINGIVVNQNIAAAIKAANFENALNEQSERKNYSPDSDLKILDPTSVLPVYNREISSIIAEDLKITEGQISSESYFVFLEKSVEEIIHSDNQITDAIFPEFQMLFIERSTEDLIAADNQIVESEIPVKDQSLDFKIINRK